MKNQIYVLAVFLLIAKLVQGQAAAIVYDPTQTNQNITIIAQQASMLQKAVDAMKQTKEIIDQGKQDYSEFQQIKSFLSTVEERVKNIGDIKMLRLNNIDNIMDNVLAIKNEDYFPLGQQYHEITRLTQEAFKHSNKSSEQLYSQTYSSKIENYTAPNTNDPGNSVPEITAKMNEFNKQLGEAAITQETMNAYSAKMKMDLAVKYKHISDEMVKESDELSLAINLDKGNNKNIALSPADRMKMMDLANQYQLKALELEEKSARLLEESARMNEEQQKKAASIESDLKMKQLINFRL